MHPDDIRKREGEYEVTATFIAARSGTCTLNNSHKVKSNTRVGKVRRIDNPLLPINGVVCPDCLKLLPRAQA